MRQTPQERKIIAGLVAVEEWNDRFRQPNPSGRYPVCKNAVGTNACERCGWPTNILMANRPPCPDVAPEDRWGEDWVASEERERK